MTNCDEGGPRPDLAPPPGTPSDQALTARLSAENVRLRQRVEQLEAERARDRQTIATLQAERDAYRRAAYAWALDQINDEALERYQRHEDGLPLAEFIDELERRVRVSKDA